MSDESTDCDFCGGRIYRMWRSKLKRGKLHGHYCSRECCDLDAWGPIFAGSSPLFFPDWKRSDHIRKISK